ncbi:MAG: ArnT family glycosyltransferase [Victivallaceae bacterium]
MSAVISFTDRLRRLPVPVLLFAAVFALLSLGVVCVEITKIDIRFALMVQDMAAHGIGVFATVNGVEYADYPSSYVFLSYVTTLGGRWINAWSLFLPSIIFGSFVVAMTWAIGARVGRGVAWCAVALELLSFNYISSFACFAIDAPVAAGIFMLWQLSRRRPVWQDALWFSAVLAACFAVRGPLGILVIGAAVGGCLLASLQWKKVMVLGICGAAVTAVCVATAYWLIIRQGGKELLDVFLQWQISSRIQEHSNYVYYFTSAVASYSPVTLPLIPLLIFRWRQCIRQPLAGWIGFLLLPMLALSVSGCKHLRYILPVIPAFALAGGWAMMEFYRGKYWKYAEPYYRWIIGRVWILAAAAVFGLLAAGTVVEWFRNSELSLCVHALAALALIALLLWKSPRAELLAVGSVAVLLYVALPPFMAIFEESAPFLRAMQADSTRTGKIYLWNVGPDHDDLKLVFGVAPEARGRIVYAGICPKDRSTQLRRMYPLTPYEDVLRDLNQGDLIVVRDDRADAVKKALAGAKMSWEVKNGKLGHVNYEALKITLTPLPPPMGF